MISELIYHKLLYPLGRHRCTKIFIIIVLLSFFPVIFTYNKCNHHVTSAIKFYPNILKETIMQNIQNKDQQNNKNVRREWKENNQVVTKNKFSKKYEKKKKKKKKSTSCNGS